MQTAPQQITIQHPLAQASEEVRTTFDHMDIFLCSKRDLLNLYESCNDMQIRAFLVGILDSREFLAVITGREF